MSHARTDSIYWDEATKAQAKEMARADRRSVSQFICWLIDQEHRRRHSRARLIDSPVPYEAEPAAEPA